MEGIKGHTRLSIAVACGGTGGHIFPGLATAEVLREGGHEVTVWLAGKNVESTAVAQWDGPVQCIRAEGLPSGISWKSVRAARRLAAAAWECRRRMRTAPPDALLAMGSFASVGPVLAAASLKVPIVLHEANVIPGKAVRWLARWASVVAINFPETARHLKHSHRVTIGMPLRKSIESARGVTCPEELDRHLFTFLVMGGSGGAHQLNELASDAFVLLHQRGVSFQVIHLTGAADEASIADKYRTHGIPARVRAFDHDMPSLYHAADFAICRSGAATCAELAVFGMPTLFVPYPHAASNHQLKNAEVLAEAGMADVREERELTGGILADYLAEKQSAPDRIAGMSAAAKRCAKHQAAERLAALVCEAAAKKSTRRKAAC